MNPEQLTNQFTQQVLDALQLDACQQAQTMLEEHEQKLLQPLHAELTRQHLEHCADCRALHAAIVMMTARLPALQSLRVPPGFTASVMNRTVQPEATRRHEQKPRRLVAWLMRPRFALESAYAMTVIVMLFSGFTGVSATDTFDSTLWERAEQQTEKMTSTYNDTARAIESWTTEKYTTLRERYAELMR